MRVFTSLLLLLSIATAGAQSLVDAEERRRRPLGLDVYMPVPEDNSLAPEKIALGRKLFSDRRLSRDGSIACASCHNRQRAFSDGRPVAVGVFGRIGRRNAPALINRGYGRAFFWDGRARTLEEQVLKPIADPNEMDLPVADAASRVGLTAEDLARALASYVRSILSGDSPYDRFVNGERTALSAEQQAGLRIFRGKGNCTACHVGPNFTDERFHNTGVAWKRLRPLSSAEARGSSARGCRLRNASASLAVARYDRGRAEAGGPASAEESGALVDAGRFAVTGIQTDRGAFKTPTLREIARTAPYMHDGSLATLEDVIDFYDAGGRSNPDIDPEIHPLHLTVEEKQTLIAFLKSLSGSIREGQP